MTSPDIVTRAEQACAQLAQDGQPVTFTAVAALAQISRATLYRDTALRALVDEHRRRAAQANTLTGLASDIAALHAALAAVAATKNNSASSPARNAVPQPVSKLQRH